MRTQRLANGNALASVHYTLGGVTDKANAYLITAAPSMLQAIRDTEYALATSGTDVDEIIATLQGVMGQATTKEGVKR